MSRNHYTNNNLPHIRDQKSFAKKGALTEEQVLRLLNQQKPKDRFVILANLSNEALSSPNETNIGVTPTNQQKRCFDENWIYDPSFEKYPITPSQNPEDILRQWKERYLYILTRNNYFKSKN